MQNYNYFRLFLENHPLRPRTDKNPPRTSVTRRTNIRYLCTVHPDNPIRSKKRSLESHDAKYRCRCHSRSGRTDPIGLFFGYGDRFSVGQQAETRNRTQKKSAVRIHCRDLFEISGTVYHDHSGRQQHRFGRLLVADERTDPVSVEQVRTLRQRRYLLPDRNPDLYRHHHLHGRVSPQSHRPLGSKLLLPQFRRTGLLFLPAVLPDRSSDDPHLVGRFPTVGISGKKKTQRRFVRPDRSGPADRQSLRKPGATKRKGHSSVPERIGLLRTVRSRLHDPRVDIEAIDRNCSVEEARQRFVDTQFSRLLVYDGNIDHVIGFIHNKSLLQYPQTILDVLKKVEYVPESMPTRRLLSIFIKKHHSVAVVIDEFGGTAGMVTIEDILEEIFGEIEDEHDSQELVEKKINDREFLFSGRLEIEAINEKYGIGLPESDDYDTLAGYVISVYQGIPEAGETIMTDRMRIRILRTDASKIELVRITLI